MNELPAAALAVAGVLVTLVVILLVSAALDRDNRSRPSAADEEVGELQSRHDDWMAG